MLMMFFFLMVISQLLLMSFCPIHITLFIEPLKRLDRAFNNSHTHYLFEQLTKKSFHDAYVVLGPLSLQDIILGNVEEKAIWCD